MDTNTKSLVGYYLVKPDRLLFKKPFTRGGDFSKIYVDVSKNLVSPNQKIKDDINTNVQLTPISQDLYLGEYHVSRHKLYYNQSMPKVAVKIGGREQPLRIENMVMPISWQKTIHDLRVQTVTNNPMEISLLKERPSDDDNLKLTDLKRRWLEQDMEQHKTKAVSDQLLVGDVGMLYRIDKAKNQLKVNVYSHEDGYHIIEHRDIYREVVGRSLHYYVDNEDEENDGRTEHIDTYDDTYMYRHIKKKDKDSKEEAEWVAEPPVPHGFIECPLLYMRDDVAWESAQPTIEMHEFLLNIQCAIARKFGTFFIVALGNFDESNVSGDKDVIVFNIQDPQSGGDIKALQYPESTTLLDMIDRCSLLIEQQSSVTNLNIDRLNTGSGDNSSNSALITAMRNDVAIATQTRKKWENFTDSMFRLFAYAQGLIDGDVTKYSDLKCQARLSLWLAQSRLSLIQEYQMLIAMGVSSKQTAREKITDLAPDETERYVKERLEEMELGLIQQYAPPVVDVVEEKIVTNEKID